MKKLCINKQEEKTWKGSHNMGEMKGTKLHYIMKVSWESEQMPGWGDSLSGILEATKKEFQIKSKDATQKKMETEPLEQETPVVGGGFSM